MPLLSPFLGNLLGSGERGAEETLTVVNALVVVKGHEEHAKWIELA